jgi:HEAT repeat protein
LKDPKASVRIGAAEALSLYSESEAVTELIRLLDDDNKSVRLKAVVLLGEIGNHKIVPLLQMRLNDEWEEVVDASKEALEKIVERENRIVN